MSYSAFRTSLFHDKYQTHDMARIFSDEHYMQKLLTVESALASSQADLGIIPQKAASQIADSARVELLDIKALHEEAQKTHHPFIPFLKVFNRLCGDASRYLHWGATTQDILDTATVLQLRDALDIIFDKLLNLNDLLARQARCHRDLIMMGRTNGQQALPITLGFKFAIWCAETQRHLQRLLECRQRLLTGQFSGAVGTLASLEHQGLALQESICQRLGLQKPLITWNTSRDNLVELASVIGIMGSTLGKVGLEVQLLQKQEIAELTEYTAPGNAGSSTMPHKRNPFVSQEITSIARILKSVVSEAFESLENEHERDPRSLNIENDYLKRLCQFADYALDNTLSLIEKLGINREAMRKNMGLLKGVIFSEAVMMKLGEHVGKAEAHDLIFELSTQALDEQKEFKQVLMENAVIRRYLDEATLDALIDPANYLGSTSTFIMQVVNENRHVIKKLSDSKSAPEQQTHFNAS